MSQKKHKKRHHSAAVTAKRQAEQEKLADEIDRSKKRMNPTARLLLWGDLVYLAVIVLLDRNGLLSNLAGSVATIIGLILLLLALWFQFGKKDGGGRTPGGLRR